MQDAGKPTSDTIVYQPSRADGETPALGDLSLVMESRAQTPSQSYFTPQRKDKAIWLAGAVSITFAIVTAYLGYKELQSLLADPVVQQAVDVKEPESKQTPITNEPKVTSLASPTPGLSWTPPTSEETTPTLAPAQQALQPAFTQQVPAQQAAVPQAVAPQAIAPQAVTPQTTAEMASAATAVAVATPPKPRIKPRVAKPKPAPRVYTAEELEEQARKARILERERQRNVALQEKQRRRDEKQRLAALEEQRDNLIRAERLKQKEIARQKALALREQKILAKQARREEKLKIREQRRMEKLARQIEAEKDDEQERLAELADKSIQDGSRRR